jgi:hypothetical protein
MRGFRPQTALPSDHIKVTTPTYLLARDEDCENSFHSTADFVNILSLSSLILFVLFFDSAHSF